MLLVRFPPTSHVHKRCLHVCTVRIFLMKPFLMPAGKCVGVCNLYYLQCLKHPDLAAFRCARRAVNQALRWAASSRAVPTSTTTGVLWSQVSADLCHHALEAKCSHLTSGRVFTSTGATCAAGTGRVCPKYIRS